MGTPSSMDRIGATLFGKTQRVLLALFFVRPEQLFYLRQIVRTAGIGQGTVQRELARWVEAGLLTRTRRGQSGVLALVDYASLRRRPAKLPHLGPYGGHLLMGVIKGLVAWDPQRGSALPPTQSRVDSSVPS